MRPRVTYTAHLHCRATAKWCDKKRWFTSTHLCALLSLAARATTDNLLRGENNNNNDPMEWGKGKKNCLQQQSAHDCMAKWEESPAAFWTFRSRFARGLGWQRRTETKWCLNSTRNWCSVTVSPIFFLSPFHSFFPVPFHVLLINRTLGSGRARVY